MALDRNDVVLIKGMLARGDRQSDIAAYFGGVNSGRISEINTGQTWADVKAAAPARLPPPGPYVMGLRSAFKARDTLEALRDLITDSLDEMSRWDKPAAPEDHA